MNIEAKDSFSILEHSPLFVVLSQEEKIRIQRSANIRKFSKHSLIYQSNAAATQVYFLLRGSVKVAMHSEKKDIIKYVVHPGNLFGESCLAGAVQRRDFAYSMEDGTEVLEMDVKAVLSAMQFNFAFAQSLLYLLGERLRHTENQLENVVLKDSKRRIVDYLQQMGTELGKPIGVETLVKHNMTHQDIADLTSTSRQMVTAVLNQLRRSNLLYFNRKKMLFRDLNALAG